MTSTPTPENGASESKSCDKHEAVTIAYKGNVCPLCAASVGGEAVAVAAIKAGLVLVNLSLAQIPFRFAPAPGFEGIVTAAVGQINTAMQELARKLNTNEEPGMIKPAPRGLVVPR